MADINPEIPATEPITPVAAAPADPPKAEPTLKDRIAELGFENVADDKEATERLIAAYKQQKDQFATQIQEAIEQVKSLKPEPSTPAPTEGEPWWKVPKIDKAAVAQFRNGEGWKDGTPDSVKQQYEAWQSRRNALAERLLDDFDGTLAEASSHLIERKVQELLGQTTQQQREQQVQQKIFSDHPWLWEKDPVNGQPKIGQLSAEGQALNQFFVEAQQRGADFGLAWDFALTKFNAAKAGAAQKKPPAEAHKAEQDKLLARGAGGRIPDRGGSVPVPSRTGQPSQNQNLTAGQKFAQKLRAEGVLLPS